MSSNRLLAKSTERPLSAGAIALMLMLCLSWGFNQIAVKLALPDIPPLLQATIRSAGALPVLLLIARFRGVKIFARDGTLGAGLLLGVIFGIEFVLIFAGVALAIGAPQANVDAGTLWGDILIVCGGALWAATTLIVKATSLRHAPAEKGLIYQVALSIPILGLAAFFFGETLTRVPGPLALSLMVYQAIWVVGLTFLLWLALVKTYSASKLSAFTFITPLFGVVASYFILHDALTLAFGAAALLVIAGLYLVNRPSSGSIDPLLKLTKT
jgi:drug/metabolite transporter (DMT)-like permease